ncbi:PIR protein CIR protein [Plasmodium vinckei]|uniref:PIR protein CIR protein n=1 Tax=Plasmodium vinckei TaxID=5860 RepID=A0A6V7SK94_PLAVN|nr:PIR protein CIR protein [Plasmodium vinckei]
MEDQEICKKFLDADKIINGEVEGNLTMYQIINDPEFNKCCDIQTCRTTKEIIGALSAYLFMKARVLATRETEPYGQYDEFFLMWLSDKLFKIAKEDDKSQNIDITLNEAYEQYLKNNIVDSNYLDLSNKINGLEEVNLMHMKHFYKLLNPICKVIAYYNPNDDDISKLIIYSTECYNQYSSLYNSVSKCNSYLHLLDNLKKTYYSFIDSVINKNEKKTELAMRLKTLKTSDGEDDYFAKDFNKFDFSDSKCKLETKLPPEPSQREQLQTQLDPVQPEPKDTSESKKPQKEGSSHQNGQDASKIDPKVSGSENGNPNGESNEPGAPSGGAGDPPSGPNAPSQEGKSDITNPPDQAGTSNTSEGSIDLWSPFFKLILNGKEYFNRASDFVDKNRQRFNDAKDKISSVYNDTVDNLKRVYNASSIYFSVMINSITNQLDQVDAPKLGSSGDNLPQSSDQSKETGDSLPPQSLTPPKDPPPNLPKISSQQNQSPPQLQSTTLQNPQVSPPTQKTIDQLVKSPSSGSILRTPWNIIPTTWNGSGDCKPKINLMSATLLCCTSEQCSLTGISVILILIPIISLIVYKYLSFGSSKKSEKKNMKRVIKLVDGNRKTQIIIKSYDRNKDLKPVINLVDRKKNPLLNIYKLMQADPIPFINLFFLLIFFVYKRKSDFLEL